MPLIALFLPFLKSLSLHIKSKFLNQNTSVEVIDRKKYQTVTGRAGHIHFPFHKNITQDIEARQVFYLAFYP